MPVEAVFFDVGNTLIYAEPPVGAVYAGVLREAGIDAAGEAVEESFRRAFRDMRARGPQPGQTDRDAMDWWRCVVRDSFEPFGQPEAFEDVLQRLWEYFARPEAWRIYGDVLPTLDLLEGRGIGIGVISNWDSRLRPMLVGLGLLERVRWPVISCEVGAEKPLPAIFRQALNCCGLPAASVMHVGDSLEADALGAMRSGLRGVWLRRQGEMEPPLEGVHLIRSLAELPGLLDGPTG